MNITKEAQDYEDTGKWNQDVWEYTYEQLAKAVEIMQTYQEEHHYKAEPTITIDQEAKGYTLKLEVFCPSGD